jgi:hypothetical protein
MGDTAVEDDELTEFELIEVESIKAVPMGANGFPHLIMKGIAETGPDTGAEPSARDLAVKAVVNGQIDEGPDVALGQQVMHLLGQAIINEAQEVSAGAYGETGDVALLTRAADMVARWCAGEQGGCGCCGECTGPGCGCCWECSGTVMHSAWAYEADEVAKAPREFTAAERKKHAKAGNALPDGSYPIPDKDALRRAAILARSKHGNWQAAERLIARRAKELGVPNPLTEAGDGKSDSKKSTVAEQETGVDTEGQDDGITKAVADAVAKATASSEDRFKQVEELAAKAERRVGQLEELIKSTPRPGGPVLSAAARPQGASAGADDFAAKAALYRAKADAATTPADREGYRQLARECDAKAAKITA